jgi:putative SOS response-associated peptidase YedK
MCNLYDIGPATNRGRNAFEKRLLTAMPGLRKIFHIRKTDPGLVLRSLEGEPEVMRWGFYRDFNPAINNARTDKLGSGMWNKAWREKRRCLIPVACFYEWTGPLGHKQAHAIAAPNGEWLWMAGLWEDNHQEGLTYTMLTTSANRQIGAIHDRMPAILSMETLAPFLAGEDPREMLAPSPADLKVFPCVNPLRMPNPGPPISDERLF